MKCVICKNGETKPGTGTVTLQRQGAVIVFRNVPGDICANCGEQYFDETTTDRLLKIAEESARAGVEVDIRHYTAA